MPSFVAGLLSMRQTPNLKKLINRTGEIKTDYNLETLLLGL
jgi:hypothetical protein